LIYDKMIRTRRSIQAALLADSLDCPLSRLQELSTEEENNISSLQETKDAFCIGLSMVREDGIAKTQQRVEYELRCLS
jgi:hypothetical protein